MKHRKTIVHPQLQQLVTLSIVLLLGKYVAHIYLPWGNILLTLLVTAVVEHLMLYSRKKALTFFSFSSLYRHRCNVDDGYFSPLDYSSGYCVWTATEAPPAL
jgi:hypothetical protein